MQTVASKTEHLHPKEVAAALGVHVSTVRRASSAGDLAALRLGPGGHYRIRGHSLLERLRQQEGASVSS